MDEIIIPNDQGVQVQVQVQLKLFPDRAALLVPQAVRLVLDGWALAVSDGEISDWIPLIREEIARSGLHPDTERQYINTGPRLARFLEAHGVTEWNGITEELLADWCEAPNPASRSRNERPLPGTVRGRMTAVLAVLGTAQRLGAPVDPRSFFTERVPVKSYTMGARPLTGEEADLLRRATGSALIPSPRSVLVALGFSGGSNKDIALVRKCDVDLEARRVRFCGVFERTNPIRKRDAATLRLYLAYDPSLGDDDLLCMAGRATSPKAARSVGERLHLALRDAGLSYIPGVTVRSIRLNGARRVLKRHGLEAAARFMGAPSLDAAAASLRHDWRRANV